MKLTSKFSALLTTALVCGLLAQTQSTHAKQGATDPIPGTSKGGVSTGGGGGGKGGSTTPAPAPAPVPVQPIISAALTFSASDATNGVCSGSYQIDPYYPTLSLMTVNVNVSSSGVADGSVLYVNVLTSGGTVYPFTSNQILVVGQGGSVAYSEYCTPGTALVGVVVTDAAGNLLFAGN